MEEFEKEKQEITFNSDIVEKWMAFEDPVREEMASVLVKTAAFIKSNLGNLNNALVEDWYVEFSSSEDLPFELFKETLKEFNMVFNKCDKKGSDEIIKRMLFEEEKQEEDLAVEIEQDFVNNDENLRKSLISISEILISPDKQLNNSEISRLVRDLDMDIDDFKKKYVRPLMQLLASSQEKSPTKLVDSFFGIEIPEAQGETKDFTRDELLSEIKNMYFFKMDELTKNEIEDRGFTVEEIKGLIKSDWAKEKKSQEIID